MAPLHSEIITFELGVSGQHLCRCHTTLSKIITFELGVSGQLAQGETNEQIEIITFELGVSGQRGRVAHILISQIITFELGGIRTTKFSSCVKANLHVILDLWSPK